MVAHCTGPKHLWRRLGGSRLIKSPLGPQFAQSQRQHVGQSVMLCDLHHEDWDNHNHMTSVALGSLIVNFRHHHPMAMVMWPRRLNPERDADNRSQNLFLVKLHQSPRPSPERERNPNPKQNRVQSQVKLHLHHKNHPPNLCHLHRRQRLK